VRLVVVLVLALVASGCTNGGGSRTTTTSSTIPTGGPPLHFGGVVWDALSARGVERADVVIDLAQTRPCRNEGVSWASYQVATDQEGRFGLVEVPRPGSDDFAFFVHVSAPGYTENVTFVGPAEARRDLGNLTLVLQPSASVQGTAPTITVIALDDAPFPRFAVSDTNGSWRFEGARVLPTALVAATDAPFRATVRAPETVTVPLPNASGWRLEGRLVLESGAPLAADVVARAGASGTLASAGRAGENGFFVLPLDAQPAVLSIEARTSDGHYGATKVTNVTGPPALRETLVMRAQC